MLCYIFILLNDQLYKVILTEERYSHYNFEISSNFERCSLILTNMTTYISLFTLNPTQENTQHIQVKLLRKWKIKLPSCGLYNLKLIWSILRSGV